MGRRNGSGICFLWMFIVMTDLKLQFELSHISLRLNPAKGLAQLHLPK